MKLLSSILHIEYDGEEFSVLTTYTSEGAIVIQCVYLVDPDNDKAELVTDFKTFAEDHATALPDVIRMLQPAVEDYLSKVIK